MKLHQINRKVNITFLSNYISVKSSKILLLLISTKHSVTYRSDMTPYIGDQHQDPTRDSKLRPKIAVHTNSREIDQRVFQLHKFTYHLIKERSLKSTKNILWPILRED